MGLAMRGLPGNEARHNERLNMSKLTKATAEATIVAKMEKIMTHYEGVWSKQALQSLQCSLLKELGLEPDAIEDFRVYADLAGLFDNSSQFRQSKFLRKGGDAKGESLLKNEPGKVIPLFEV